MSSSLQTVTTREQLICFYEIYGLLLMISGRQLFTRNSQCRSAQLQTRQIARPASRTRTQHAADQGRLCISNRCVLWKRRSCCKYWGGGGTSQACRSEADEIAHAAYQDYGTFAFWFFGGFRQREGRDVWSGGGGVGSACGR